MVTDNSNYSKSIELRCDSDTPPLGVGLFILQIIGEASGHISPSIKKKHKNIAWIKLKRLRNFIVHEYFGVDYGYVWYTVKNYLPRLKSDIEVIEKEIK